MTNDYAKLTLNFYNQKTHKNFNLEEVVKLNRTPSAFYCMTFKARNAESDECYLFRGVVSVVGGPQVLLCEIKDEKEISIPAGHDEYYDEESSGSLDDIYPYTRYGSSKNHTQLIPPLFFCHSFSICMFYF